MIFVLRCMHITINELKKNSLRELLKYIESFQKSTNKRRGQVVKTSARRVGDRGFEV